MLLTDPPEDARADAAEIWGSFTSLDEAKNGRKLRGFFMQVNGEILTGEDRTGVSSGRRDNCSYHRNCNRNASSKERIYRPQPEELWREAPLLTGHVQFDPTSDVKNVLVTGGEGFIASWFVRHLVTKYPSYTVISFDKLDYASSLNNSRMLQKYENFTFRYGDVAKAEDVSTALNDFSIDTVFHFAAKSHVDASFKGPREFWENNTIGTSVLLFESSKARITRFYYVSTDEVYGETDEEAVFEQSPHAPTNPYAASKSAAESFVSAYSTNYRLPTVTVRLNNVYGPHQYPEKIIPKFISQLRQNLSLTLHGTGLNSRCYLFAGDAADAFDTILHRGELGQTYNIGSKDEITNIDLAKKLLQMFDVEDTESRIQYQEDRPFNDSKYIVDDSKLRSLGWYQRTTFDEGLNITLDWYNKFDSFWNDGRSYGDG